MCGHSDCRTVSKKPVLNLLGKIHHQGSLFIYSHWLLRSPSRRSMKWATINGVTYEGVTEFIYLGTLISNDNSVQKEIQRRILAGNRTYFAAISLFRNRLLSRATKILLYKTLIRPIVAYGAETCKITKNF